MKTVNAQEQIQQLLDTARDLRWFDYHQVIELGQTALEFAREINDPLWITRSLNMIAWGYNRLDQPNDSLEYAREAFHLANVCNLLEEYGYAICNLAFCYEMAGEYSQTLNLIEQLKKIAEENNFYELQVFANNDLGIKHLQGGDLKTGIYLLEKSLTLTEKYQLDVPKTFGYQNLAQAYLDYNDIEQCIKYSQLAYDDALIANFVLGEMLALETLSRLHIRLNDPEKGLYYAQKSYDIAIKSNYDATRALYCVANAYVAQEQYDQALEIYQQIYDAVQIQNSAILCPLHRSLSDIYAKQGNFELAYHHLQKSNEAFNIQSVQETERQIEVLKTQHQLETMQREAHFQQAQSLMYQAEMKERLKRQHAELGLEKQRELMRAKNEILTRINHEFRTPVSILRVSFELLTRYQDRLTPENKDEHIRRIEEQFQHINNLLDDVLDALNINTQSELLIAPIDVRSLAFSAITLAERRTRTENRVNLQIHQVPSAIYHSEESIEQIIVNLLTNAIKFSEDEVLLELYTTPNNQLVIKVTDKGIGIPSDEQESVFEILGRGSNLNEVSGTGMGLALVKQSVEILDGTIKLDSKLGQGTVFTIALPLIPNQHTLMP